MWVETHSVAGFTQALRDLMPPGEAWDWPVGGLGHGLQKGIATELSRIDALVPDVLTLAIERHRVKLSSFTLADYQAVADASQVGVVETMPRKVFVAGSKAGERLWQDAGSVFPVPLVKVERVMPFCAGSKAGERLWSNRARFILVVRYYKTVANVQALWDALMAFKQAHMYLFFIDITQSGGEVLNAQD